MFKYQFNFADNVFKKNKNKNEKWKIILCCISPVLWIGVYGNWNLFLFKIQCTVM